MSFETLIALDQFIGNGSTVIFDLNYKYYNDSDLVIVLTDAAGVDTVQTITTDYALSNKAENAHDPTKGRVTSVTPPAGGGTPELLTVYRKPALTQLLVLITTGGWRSLDVEKQFDLLVMIAQDFQLQHDRTSKYAYTNLSTPSSLELLELAAGVGLISALPGMSALADADLFRVGDDDDSGIEKKLTALNAWVYFLANHIATSAGAGDAGKAIKLNGSGLVDPSMISLPAASTTVAGIQENADASEMANDTGLRTVTPDILDLSRYQIRVGTSDPTVNYDSTAGYVVGGMVVNTATPSFWRASSVAVGAAVWDDLSGGGGWIGTATSDLDMNAYYILFNALKGIKDSSGNEVLLFSGAGSATNHFEMVNGTTAVQLKSIGTDSSIPMVIFPKASYISLAGGVQESLGIGYTVTTDDVLNFLPNTSTGAKAIQLRTAQTSPGRRVTIADYTGNAGASNITITTEGAQTINGAGTHIINTNYGAVQLLCATASSWVIT